MRSRAATATTGGPRPGLHWAQIFHFYQPPTQTHEVLARIVEESYRPLLTILHRFPEARVALQLNGVLVEALAEHGFGDVLERLRVLGERGQVEFLGSGKFHPILPLCTERERECSIVSNAQTNARLLGPSWRPSGFFPPELAFGPEIVPAVARAGHRWILLSGVAATNHWPLAEVQRTGLAPAELRLLYRDDARSNRVAFRQTNAADWVRDLESQCPDQGASYIVTAMDAETFGHHIPGWEREFLAGAYGLVADGEKVHMTLPSEVVDTFPPGASVAPRPSSWSTSGDDIASGNPYPLWKSPANPLHELQWEYVTLVRELLATAASVATGAEARRMAELAEATLHPALHSCQFWWASGRPWWEPIMVQRGLGLLTQVLLYAERAVVLSDVAQTVRREAGWKVAAADDLRTRLERALFGGPA